MTKEEMEKKRDDLAAEKMEPYLPDYKNIVGAMVCVGWDACAAEYEKEIERLNALLKYQIKANLERKALEKK